MRRGRSLLLSIFLAIVSVILWQGIGEPLPHLPTSDLYTHLSVARHLSQGDGFVTDITYPLSFAYPFARELPQPLIHRPPGFPLLLQIPYATAGNDPYLTLTHVRFMQLIILGLIVVVGAYGFLRRGKWPALLPWLVFFLTNPLLRYAVDWGFVELISSLLLLIILLRGREAGKAGPGLIDGFLAGILVLLRFDLFWVPWFWFIWWRADRVKETPGTSFFSRRLLGAFLVYALLMTPWAVRNVMVTGQPFFSLQAQAELVKMTPTWPGYSVYKQLEPQPLLQTLQQEPLAALNKAIHGLWYFLKNHFRFMPWILFWAGAIPAILFSASQYIKIFPGVFFHKAKTWTSILPEKNPGGPNSVAFITYALICLQYSFFDHDQRHLLVLLPVMLWEIMLLIGHYAPQLASRSNISRLARINKLQSSILGLAAALLIVFLMPYHLPGWVYAKRYAEREVPEISQRIAWVEAHPTEVLFDETSAVPWFVNRPAVWSPANTEIRNRIKAMLSNNK